jgi:hypothetical protein
MADDESEANEEPGESSGDEEKSFRERVEEIRQKRAEEDDGEGMSREERMEEMMGGGGGPGGMGGGNPFAQMMGGMMGGGGGPGGMGGGPPGQGGAESGDNEELTREIRKLRDEVHDVRRSLDRIADALEE